MGQWNEDYRLQNELREIIGKQRGARELARLCEANGTEQLTCVFAECKIHSDWVDHIESGLTSIGNAIDEARSFIRQDGDIVRIDQVKQVSKESVRHLAQHSNLITRIPEPEQIPVPDALLVMEKTDNYVIYENRFLFTLLSLISGFVEDRCRKIAYWRDRYEAQCRVEHELNMGERCVKIAYNCYEVSRNDGWPGVAHEQNELWDRICNIRVGIASLLQTSLMKEVAPAGCLSGPIQRTNVMKMNPDFRGATELYDYIMSYTGDGFEVIKHEKKIEPFSRKGREDFAALLQMQLFLMRMYGMDGEAMLQKEAELEDEAERQRAIQQTAERLDSLKNKLKQGQMSAEEYILELENGVNAMKKEAELAFDLRRQNRTLISEKSSLEQTTAELRDEMHEISLSRDETWRELSTTRQTLVVTESKAKGLEEKLDAVQKNQAEREAALAEAENKAAAALHENMNALAELHALRQKHGEWDGADSDFSERERYNQLVMEYKAMQGLYREQKRKAKRSIRSRIFGALRAERKS